MTAKTKPRPPAPSEASILKSCLAILQAHGVFCWRQNTGAFSGTHNGKRRFVRFGVPGISDILGAWPDGRLLAVEIKCPGNRPTAAQEAFMRAVNDRGGFAFWVDGTEGLMNVLRDMGLAK